MTILYNILILHALITFGFLIKVAYKQDVKLYSKVLLYGLAPQLTAWIIAMGFLIYDHLLEIGVLLP